MHLAVKVRLTVVTTIAIAVSVTACASTPESPAPSGGASPSNASSPPAVLRPLPTDGIVDYQLGGAYDPPDGTTIVARDSTEQPAAGLYSICYLNGFQTQPQDADWWRASHPDLLLSDANGFVTDRNWPDEYLLDTSTDQTRAELRAIEYEWIAGCAAKGFDAVEFDNLDTYSRSHDALTVDDNLALATALVSDAHSLGLSAAQKNSAELAQRGRDEVGFDFVVAEECQRYDECGVYTDVYGANVIAIEYFDDLGGTINEVCNDPSLPPLTVFRDRDLVVRGQSDYRFEVCA
jgi:hypothetical protein